MSEISN